MISKSNTHIVIIGRSELIFFPDADLPGIPAKTDTGAYRSSIHASSIEYNPQTKVLSFDLLAGHPVFGSLSHHIETSEFKRVTIENSFGHTQGRYEVLLKVRLGSKSFVSSFTLADRSKKNFPILLGRKLLSNRFIVDSSKTSLDVVELKRTYKINVPIDEEEKYQAA